MNLKFDLTFNVGVCTCHIPGKVFKSGFCTYIFLKVWKWALKMLKKSQNKNEPVHIHTYIHMYAA